MPRRILINYYTVSIVNTEVNRGCDRQPVKNKVPAMKRTIYFYFNSVTAVVRVYADYPQKVRNSSSERF